MCAHTRRGDAFSSLENVRTHALYHFSSSFLFFIFFFLYTQSYSRRRTRRDVIVATRFRRPLTPSGKSAAPPRD